MLPLIALEEHFVSSKVREAERVDHYATFPPHIMTKLQSLGNERIQDLDGGNVSLQVISHGPGDRSPALCTAANDELASAISKNPTRMAGFAMLPMNDPTAATKELERCVRDLRFVGALVDSHVNGHFYDEKRFWTVFEKAQELNVPVYIHPSFPADDMAEHYKGDYDDSVALALVICQWVIRQFPKVKILIGHMGEMLPFQLERVILTSERWGRRRGLRDVWTENIWITTSGMFALPPLACLLQTTSIDHVLYSVDYPFSSNEKGLEFFREVEKSGLIAGKDLEKFAFRNAESLLGVKAEAF